jgi:hypothetical protein
MFINPMSFVARSQQIANGDKIKEDIRTHKRGHSVSCAFFSKSVYEMNEYENCKNNGSPSLCDDGA